MRAELRAQELSSNLAHVSRSPSGDKPVFPLVVIFSHYNNVYNYRIYIIGARSTLVVKALCYKPEGLGFETRSGELILMATLGPGVYSASNRNEYQKQKIMFLGSKARPVRRGDKFTATRKPIALTMWDS
jgi:hypothetical protein